MGKANGTILVLGATGQQGGSVARALLDDGWAVRALVRDPQADKARALTALGIETVRGDLGDKASLSDAVTGCYGVFSVQPSSGQPEYGVTDDDEVRFGVSVADAAQHAGIEHFVYTSVAGAGPETGVGHYSSKWEVEQQLRTLAMDWTVVRPTAFMEILALPAFGLDKGELTFFMEPDRTMQFIAVEDIGRIVAKVFANRVIFRNETVEIAGDRLTGIDLANKIGAATGRAISYQRFPEAVLDEVPVLARLVQLVAEGPAAGRADLPALRRLHPGLLTFDSWLKRTGKALFPGVE